MRLPMSGAAAASTALLPTVFACGTFCGTAGTCGIFRAAVLMASAFAWSTASEICWFTALICCCSSPSLTISFSALLLLLFLLMNGNLPPLLRQSLYASLKLLPLVMTFFAPPKAPGIKAGAAALAPAAFSSSVRLKISEP